MIELLNEAWNGFDSAHKLCAAYLMFFVLYLLTKKKLWMLLTVAFWIMTIAEMMRQHDGLQVLGGITLFGGFTTFVYACFTKQSKKTGIVLLVAGFITMALGL